MTESVSEACCIHPDEELDEAIRHLGDPTWAFCHGCRSVLRREGDKWVAPKPRYEVVSIMDGWAVVAQGRVYVVVHDDLPSGDAELEARALADRLNKENAS